MADALEPRRERRHAALLRLAAQDPVDVVIGRQRARRGVGIGRLAVVDVDDVADGRDALLAMRQAGIGRQAGDDLLARHAEPAAGRPGAGGVLRVVVARQGRHVGEIDRVAVGIDQHAGAVRDAAGDRGLELHRHGRDAALDQLGIDGARRLVVDADHGAVADLLAGEDVLLGGDIARQIAMAIDMVGRDVEPHRDMGVEGLQQFELVGRQLQHVEAALAQRRQVERAAADIAADLAAHAGLGEDMADQRRRRRLAVGAGDGDEPRLVLGARQQLDVADDRLAGGARRGGHGMRLGKGAGNARADDQRGDARPVDARGVGDVQPGLHGGIARGGVVVPADAVDAGRLQGASGRQAGARQPQHDERRTFQHAEIDHPLTAASGWRGRPSPGWRR